MFPANKQRHLSPHTTGRVVVERAPGDPSLSPPLSPETNTNFEPLNNRRSNLPPNTRHEPTRLTEPKLIQSRCRPGCLSVLRTKRRIDLQKKKKKDRGGSKRERGRGVTGEETKEDWQLPLPQVRAHAAYYEEGKLLLPAERRTAQIQIGFAENEWPLERRRRGKARKRNRDRASPDHTFLSSPPVLLLPARHRPSTQHAHEQNVVCANSAHNHEFRKGLLSTS